MKGKTLLMKNFASKFWEYDVKTKNSKGKKYKSDYMEARRANRKIRYEKNEIDETNNDFSK